MSRVLALLVLLSAAPVLAGPDLRRPVQDGSGVRGWPSPLSPQPAPRTPNRQPDVVYVPTPEEVVDAMLKLARVTDRDVVYDLGCGDGRIVIAAAKQYGARGLGVDIDPRRIREARINAQQAGVSDRVRFIQGDLFETDLRPATVVTLYLLESLNQKLKPKLIEELRPGARVVSHAFGMGAWEPDTELDVDGRRVFLWTVPASKPAEPGAGGN